MQQNNNIPKLPNDIIFYILKMNRLEEGKRVQKVIKNKQQNNPHIKAIEDGYKPKNVWKDIYTNYIITELRDLGMNYRINEARDDYIFYDTFDMGAKYYLYKTYKIRFEDWLCFKDKPKHIKTPNWFEEDDY